MRCSKIPESQLVPIEVIEGAIAGDSDAIDYVLKHFERYIITMATRELHDEYGQTVYWLDHDLKRRLENKLIASIIRNFHIR